MKITKQQLKQIIKEELENVLQEEELDEAYMSPMDRINDEGPGSMSCPEKKKLVHGLAAARAYSRDEMIRLNNAYKAKCEVEPKP
jgi:hypothetical protein